jgi:hypothetical protein
LNQRVLEDVHPPSNGCIDCNPQRLAPLDLKRPRKYVSRSGLAFSLFGFREFRLPPNHATPNGWRTRRSMRHAAEQTRLMAPLPLLRRRLQAKTLSSPAAWT